MVVVVAQAALVTAEGVQAGRQGPVGLDQPVDRVAIQGEGDGQSVAQHVGEVQGRGVIVVVVGPATVPAPFVQLADQGGDFPAIVGGVEDGDAVGGQGDGSLEEAVGGDRQGLRGRHRTPRQLPVVRPKVIRGHRDLPLPRRDPLHHPVRGHAIAADVEVGCVPPMPHGVVEAGEGARHQPGEVHGIRAHQDAVAAQASAPGRRGGVIGGIGGLGRAMGGRGRGRGRVDAEDPLRVLVEPVRVMGARAFRGGHPGEREGRLPCMDPNLHAGTLRARDECPAGFWMTKLS